MKPVLGRVDGSAAVELACEWGDDGLLVGHADGSFSIVEHEHIISIVQNPARSIKYMRAFDQTAYVCFENGVLAQYALPTGILQQYVQLGEPIEGMFVQQETIVLWGIKSQVIFLSRFSLDIENTLTFDSKPVRVSRDGKLCVILRSGLLYTISDDLVPSIPIILPLNVGTYKDIIDAACIDRGKWVLIQRDKWSIVQEIDGEYQLELNSDGPSYFQKLLFCSRINTFVALCDDGQLLLVENNNIQIMYPQWPPFMLKGLIYYKQNPFAILKDGRMFYSVHSPADGWTWQSSSFGIAVTGTAKWLLSGEYAAKGQSFGVLSKDCVFKETYNAHDRITSLLVTANATFLGLHDGSVQMLKGGALVGSFSLLAMPILHLKYEQDCLLAWSRHTIAFSDTLAEGYPIVMAADDFIENVEIHGGHLIVAKLCTGVQAWDLLTMDTAPAPSVEFGDATSFPVTIPFASADGYKLHGDTWPGFSFSHFNTVALLNPDHCKKMVAAIATWKCSQGLSLYQADEQLRADKVHAECFEEFVVLIDHRNELLRKTCTQLLQSLTDDKRMNSLMKAHGIRPSLVFSNIYPQVPVEEELTARTKELLGGPLTEKLAALRILASHPSLLPFPFNDLYDLGINSAIERFIVRASEVDLKFISQALCTEINLGDAKHFVLCVKCVHWIVEGSSFDLQTSGYLALIDSVARAVHRMPSGLSTVRLLLVRLLSKFPNNVVFNKQRQLLLVKSRAAGNGAFGVVWDLGNGNKLVLARPTVSADVALPGFSDDGKALVTGRFVWKFPGTIASLFSGDGMIAPVDQLG